MKNPVLQSGAVLPVALFILTIVTLVGVSTLDTSKIGLRIAHNQQGQMQTELAVNQAVEQLLSTAASFQSPAAQVVTVVGSGGSFEVNLSEPRCLFAQKMPGYSALNPNSPELTYWEFTAESIDPITGARVASEHGVRVRLPPFQCG